MEKLIVIRHGESVFNEIQRTWHTLGRPITPNDDPQGWLNVPDSDGPLTENGRAQARQLQSLHATLEKPLRIVSSTFLRAKQTAEEGFPGEPIEHSEKLVERNWGSIAEYRKQQAPGPEFREIAQKSYEYETHQPFGGESFAEARARIVPELERLMGETEGTLVLVVHGDVRHVIMQYLSGMSYEEWYKNVFLAYGRTPNCCVDTYTRSAETNMWSVHAFCYSSEYSLSLELPRSTSI